MAKNNTKKEPIEKQLWKAANKLRKNIENNYGRRRTNSERTLMLQNTNISYWV
jgi:hypothetical protein